MKFAICHELFEGWSLERSFGFSAELGYDGIELAPFVFGIPVSAVTGEKRNEIRRTAEEFNLEIVGLHWLLSKTSGLHLTTRDPETRERTRDYLIDLIRYCSDVGGKVMVFGSPPQRNREEGQTMEEAMANAKEVFDGCLGELDSHGITICFEPLSTAETDFVTTAEQGRELVEMVGHPRFRLHLDVKAMASEDKPIPEIIRENGDIMAHFHANDPNLRGPGMGDLDFTPIVEALRDVGYDRWVSVETFDSTLGAETNARESIQYLRKVFGEE